jgi:hypothetical protein
LLLPKLMSGNVELVGIEVQELARLAEAEAAGE